jgi:hypothetical protein
MGRWMVPALPLARSAEIFLLAVGSTPIAHQRISATVGTLNRHRYHVTFHPLK